MKFGLVSIHNRDANRASVNPREAAGMTSGISIRRPRSAEYSVVRSVVQTVVDETYGGLWAPPPLQIDEEDWSAAWIGVQGAAIAGMALTHREWLSDLWVLKEFRGIGIGGLLLARAEAEIAERGNPSARLRVVRSNANALSFYTAHDWAVKKEFPHEQLPITMVQMEKELGPTDRRSS
jgi:ribosomal protein S18 acetylase RimI-like enzyme